jgi:hypothetical protein
MWEAEADFLGANVSNRPIERAVSLVRVTVREIKREGLQ